MSDSTNKVKHIQDPANEFGNYLERVQVINSEANEDYMKSIGTVTKELLVMAKDDYRMNCNLMIETLYPIIGDWTSQHYSDEYNDKFNKLLMINSKLEQGVDETEILSDLEILDIEYEMMVRHSK